MEEKQIYVRPCKIERVSFFEAVYCTWVIPLFWRGHKQPLTNSDVYAAPKEDDAETLADALEANWRKELQKKNPSFARATLKTYYLRFLPLFCIFFWDEVILRTAQALMLSRIMKIFTDGQWTSEEYLHACLYSAGIVGASTIYIMGHHPACFLATRLAIQIRVAWCTLIYRKVSAHPFLSCRVNFSSCPSLSSHLHRTFVFMFGLFSFLLNDCFPVPILLFLLLYTMFVYDRKVSLLFISRSVFPLNLLLRFSVSFFTLDHDPFLIQLLTPNRLFVPLPYFLRIPPSLTPSQALRLNHSAFGKTTVGTILNLISNDVSRLDEFCIICNNIIVAPLQVLAGMIVCYHFVGFYCLIGLATLLAFIPLNSVVGRSFFAIRTRVAVLSDNRIKIMSEIIKGMRVLKMYAWEKHFSLLISAARK